MTRAAHACSFVTAQTAPGHAALVPEITLHLASEITPIWQATEAWLAEHQVEPPFWAFAWPGGQALARHVLDHPSCVAGRRVLDFAAGSGIAAIACAMAGAASVEAAEIDFLARAAIGLNAAANRVAIALSDADVVGADCRWDLILCGDVCYEAPMTAHILPWLRRMARHAEVWLADPGRAYLPRDGLTALRRLSRADQPGTGGPDRAAGHALPARLLTRLALGLAAPAQLRQVQAVHRQRRSVAHHVPHEPVAIRLGQSAQHDQRRQGLLQVRIAVRLRRQVVEPRGHQMRLAVPCVRRR